MSFFGSRKASLAGGGSWFQQVTVFPAFISGIVRPSCDPMQSPSGRTCPTMQIVSLPLMASTIRSTIFGWTFIRDLVDLLDDFQNAVAALNGLINNKFQMRRVFQN